MVTAADTGVQTICRHVRGFGPQAITVRPLGDGRQHCSQMTSCDEATFFIEYCPDTQMDGDHDGVPCEEHWCSF